MPVGAAALLQLWERALPLDTASRAVLLAASVAPPAGTDEVMEWPLGRRDARLLQLRTALSGGAIDAVTVCPNCDAELSFEVDPVALEQAGEVMELEPVIVDGWHVHCRPITTADLAAVAAMGDATTGEQLLLERAVVRTTPPPGVGPTPVPVPVRRAVADALAAADPLAEILVELGCPECGECVTVTLDVAAFAWAALDTRARRLLQDVDLLARTYGWSEDEVVALSDQRRAAYVGLAGGTEP